MKICILTQPLHTNYGGILQAYALQKILKGMGNDAVTLNTPMPVSHSIKGRIKRFLTGLIRGSKASTKAPEGSDVHLKRFIAENINYTEPFKLPLLYEDIRPFGFGAFVVGSDQTWRPKYSPHLPTFFLDFLENQNQIKKISYAASFGTEELEYSEKMLAICRPLIAKFNDISVREDSAIPLLKRHFGVNAERVLDPTMMLKKSDYAELIRSDELGGFLPKSESSGKCSSYILDNSGGKEQFLNSAAARLGLETFKFCGKQTAPRQGGLKAFEFKPVTEWIRMFSDSNFIITDSFHGTVFSIIFNKPFITIANKKRGAARFHSLLSIFGLESRLAQDGQFFAGEAINSKIDWENINKILESEREKSFNFLKTALGDA